MVKFVVLLCALVAAVVAFDEAQMYRDIAASVARAKARTSNPEFYADEKACYPDIGCFTIDGPLKHTGILPFPPEKVATSFYVYHATTPNSGLIVDPHKKESFGPVDAKKRLVIITHGFGNSHTTPELQSIKNNLLKDTAGEVGSVIVVDWAKGAAQPDYDEASRNTEVVGRQIAFLVSELHKGHAVDPKKVYLIGFSLGAQVSGFAGRWLQSEYKLKFGRITGLDAAAPMFEDHDGAHLQKGDADFVDGIHTSVGTNVLLGEIGYTKAYADLDFFPNSGHHQPMCHNIFKIACNHYASVLFYDASLSAHATCKFSAFACKDWATFETHKDATCLKSDVELGYNADKAHATGTRWLNTTGAYPYCH